MSGSPPQWCVVRVQTRRRPSAAEHAVARSVSRTWLADAAAAVDWLATELLLAATTMRLVTAMMPKMRTTMATRASTRVNPASPEELLAFGSGWVMAVFSLLCCCWMRPPRAMVITRLRPVFLSTSRSTAPPVAASDAKAKRPVSWSS